MKKISFITIMFIAAAALASCADMRREPVDIARNVVSQATDTVNRFSSMPDLKGFAEYMPAARGIVVLPNVIKGGLMFGGEGGNGVLLVRRANGSWSQPAFYILGAASFGIQAGLQNTEIILLLQSDKAIDAVIDHQGKLGADAGITVGMIGAGAEVSTTTNIGLDVLAFANAKVGLFGGASLEGAVLARRTDLNEAYYGMGAGPRDILFGNAFANAQSGGLRAALGAE